ncbi:MAG: glutaminase A [Salinarimonas sp.]|nr:glutaminase A [Salinarimonas sp.]
MADEKERGRVRDGDDDSRLGAFGIAVHTADGTLVKAGDHGERFPIQSISKVFSLTLALERAGEDLWQRVGREPSGDPYNSIIDLERHHGIPRNPFINAGALVVIDVLLASESADERVPEPVRARIAALLGIEDEAQWPDRNAEILDSFATGHVNRALAHLTQSYGNLHHPIDRIIDTYVHQCAVRLNCGELARAGRYLMQERLGDATDSEQDVRMARRINALMLTCGQYDGSGEFAYRVGLPAKSGVSGGILAIVPNHASIAVWSPGLDESGNSALGTRALACLAEEMDWSVFGASFLPDNRL